MGRIREDSYVFRWANTWFGVVEAGNAGERIIDRKVHEFSFEHVEWSAFVTALCRDLQAVRYVSYKKYNWREVWASVSMGMSQQNFRELEQVLFFIFATCPLQAEKGAFSDYSLRHPSWLKPYFVMMLPYLLGASVFAVAGQGSM